jgi:hypothetical protein
VENGRPRRVFSPVDTFSGRRSGSRARGSARPAHQPRDSGGNPDRALAARQLQHDKPMRVLALRGIAILLSVATVSSSALADDPPAPAPTDATTTPTDTTTTTTATPTPSESPESPPAQGSVDRDTGARLGLELGFARAVAPASLIPLGLSASWRLSAKALIGAHAHAALASRDDCGSNDCTARGYALGLHMEHPLGTGPTVVPWIRYGSGWEVLYRGGLSGLNDGYLFRHAFDVLDVRFGTDFVAARGQNGKTTRVGPFIAGIAGVTVAQTGAYNDGRQDINPSGSAGHFWLGGGLRATIDP